MTVLSRFTIVVREVACMSVRLSEDEQYRYSIDDFPFNQGIFSSVGESALLLHSDLRKSQTLIKMVIMTILGG
jgi:hypothetical protein